MLCRNEKIGIRSRLLPGLYAPTAARDCRTTAARWVALSAGST